LGKGHGTGGRRLFAPGQNPPYTRDCKPEQEKTGFRVKPGMTERNSSERLDKNAGTRAPEQRAAVANAQFHKESV